MRLPIIISIIFLSAAMSHAAKPPWDWTPQERAQARRDPTKRLERLRAHDEERRTWQVQPNRLPAVADVIDGGKNPELFFPTELFEYLVRSAFVTLPRAYPAVVRSRTTDLFKDSADWNRFAAIVADYVEILKEEKASADAVNQGAISAIQTRKCAAQARAIREARRVFGRKRFDRMLYETVPVSISRSFSADTDFDRSIRSAIEREEHCQ
jgi:hypothetical protein